MFSWKSAKPAEFQVLHQPTSNGTYRYLLKVDGQEVMISKRTFLTVHESRIESEWLLWKLGYEVTSREQI